MIAPAPAYPAIDLGRLTAALGKRILSARNDVGEPALHVAREELVGVLTSLRDEHEYQQLMEIAGVDYPDRSERFEVVYCLLSLTKNHRIRVHVSTDEETAVPTVTGLWPVAGWLEREVYDMYGVFFDGNTDLRRILTDYGFTGHPQRKDFPLTGFVELRYSEEAKRVVYEPVQLPQDFRTFDFMSPWEGAEYVLPGDEKGMVPEAKGAPTPLNATQIQKADAAKVADAAPPPAPKTTDTPAQTGAGKATPKAEPKPADPDVVPKRRTAKVAQAADATDEKPKKARAPRKSKTGDA